MKTSVIGTLLSCVAVLCSAQVNVAIQPGGLVQLSHASSPSQQYFLERSFDLAQWFKRGSIAPGTGSNITWSDVPGASRGFYRVASGPLIAHRVFGFNFEPYVDGQDPNLHTQISRAQMEQRMRLLIPYTDWIRTFRTVDGFEVAGTVARQLGFSTALGAWIGPETTPAGIQANQQNVANLIAAGQAGEADILVVGNEALHFNWVPAATLINYINQVRAAVPGIPVTTVDIYGDIIDNPNVINACDILMVNIYPFWEGYAIENAMANVHQNYHNTKAVANGKPVWISEAGWPSAGQTQGAAVPSLANSAAFFHRFVTWSRAKNVPSLYFEAFNETWKASTGEGAVGSNWGVWDKDGVMKAGMQTIFDTQFSPADWNAVIGGAGTPSISITTVPAVGSGVPNIQGTVSHVAPFDVLVVVYIKVGGQWWGAKPFERRPYSPVSASGVWSTTFAPSGGGDLNATEFAAYLFPKDYIPQGVLGQSSLPAALAANALATATASRP